MTSTLDFKKMNRTIKVFGAVQMALVGLLVYMAVNFQHLLRIQGREFRFTHGVLASFVIQLLMFYPISRFAAKEADRDLAVTASNITNEQMNAFAKKKRWSDVIKIGGLAFFVMFVMAAPKDTFVLSIIYYTFILTILTYLQCYNFAARKLREKATS